MRQLYVEQWLITPPPHSDPHTVTVVDNVIVGIVRCEEGGNMSARSTLFVGMEGVASVNETLECNVARLEALGCTIKRDGIWKLEVEG